MARTFNEATDYVTLADGAYLDLPHSNWSRLFWVNIGNNAGETYKYIFSHGGSVLSPATFNVYLGEANSGDPNLILVVIRDDTDTAVDLVSSVTYDPSVATWGALIVQRAGQSVNLYWKGALVGSVVHAFTQPTSPAGAAVLGGRYDLNPGRFFGGYLADVAGWARSLTAGEIASLSNPASGVRARDLASGRTFLYELDPDGKEFSGGSDAALTGTAFVASPFGAGNQAPVAEFNFEVELVVGSNTVYFSPSASHDPDGIVVAYHWDFGDGSDSSEPEPMHTYDHPGVYLVSLVVTDNQGAVSGPVSKSVTVGELHVVRVRRVMGAQKSAFSPPKEKRR